MGLLVSSLLFSVPTPSFGLVITRIVNRVFHRGKTPLLVRAKEAEMQTLDEWKTVLAKDFLELQHLEGQDAATRMRRPMKEQEIGQHCQLGQEQVSAMPISLHSKKHWGSMNSTGTPTSPKSDPNQQKQMRQRQVYPACNSRPSPTPASVPRVTTTRNSRPARTGLWLV